MAKDHKNNENSNNAFANSCKKPPKEYTPTRKKQNISKLNRAIRAIVIAVILAGTIAISSIATNAIIDHNNVVISTDAANSIIDEKIEYYEIIMSTNSPNPIETLVERQGNEKIVKYEQTNINNLAKYIVEAAKISESETRCVILAAYNTIDEGRTAEGIPFKEDILGKALVIAKEQQEENFEYEIPSDLNTLLEQFGYESLEDYNKGEKEKINELKAAEEYVTGTNNRKVI